MVTSHLMVDLNMIKTFNLTPEFNRFRCLMPEKLPAVLDLPLSFYQVPRGLIPTFTKDPNPCLFVFQLVLKPCKLDLQVDVFKGQLILFVIVMSPHALFLMNGQTLFRVGTVIDK
jgi:hypothetical protein